MVEATHSCQLGRSPRELVQGAGPHEPPCLSPGRAHPAVPGSVVDMLGEKAFDGASLCGDEHGDRVRVLHVMTVRPQRLVSPSQNGYLTVGCRVRNMGGLEPLIMSAWGWERDDTRNALISRDVGALFRAVQRYTGASQSRIGAATGLLQGRVSEILKGNRSVSALDVFERIADGIAMPDEARILLGIAPRHPVGIGHLGPAGRAEVAAVYTSQQDAMSDSDPRRSPPARSTSWLCVGSASSA
jgi:hypothetical protein